MLPQTIICYMVMETAAKLKYFPTKGGCLNYFSPRESLYHVKLDYKKHCSVPLLSYILTHNEPTLTQHYLCTCIGLSSLHAMHTKQDRYECCHIPTRQVITQPYITVIPTTPTIIATIDALGKSNGIQNLMVTDLDRHLLFDFMTLLCLQERMTMMMMTTLLLHKCKATTLLLHNCHYMTLLLDKFQYPS